MSDAALPSSPFKGLVPYSERDAPFFFGREREREIISNNLIASRLTLLYGASGVGKSSVLQAGVACHLRRLAHENLERYGTPEVAVVTFREWRDNPTRALNERVNQSLEELIGDRAMAPKATSESFIDTLAGWSDTLNCDLLVILDQFEEYFLYHQQDVAEDGFADDFVHAVNRADLRANFLIALREDELAKLDRFKGRIPHLFDSYLRIEHLDRTAARAAIEKPIEEYNRLLPGGATRVSIESKLIDAVLDQVRAGKVSLNSGTGAGLIARASVNDRIETPYLQLVMNRLWAEDGYGKSGCLRLATLDRLGGAERIVRTHLDLAMDALSPDEQDAAAGIFHHLVTPSGTKIAHAVSDLSEYTGLSYPQVMSVLTRLSGGDVRILRPVASPPGRPETPRFEIFHDVLAAAILDWRARYTKKRDEAAQERKLLDAREQAERRLSQERAQHDAELARTRAAAEQQRADVAEALATSERRARIRQRDFTIALLVALVLMVGFLLWALNERRTAHSRELAARAISALSEDPERSLRLAQEAKIEAGTSEIAEADDALRQSLAAFHVRTRIDAGHIDVAAFSADGRHVVTSAGDSGVATIRHIDSPSTETPLVGHKARVTSAAFSPDGTRVATASEDHTVIVWDTASGQARVPPLTGHRAAVTSVAFSPDGTRIVTASADCTARVWDATSGRLLHQLPGHGGALTTATFSPDGSRIVTASEDQTARVWDAASGAPLKELRGHQAYVQSAAFTQDGARIVTAGADRTARLWDASTGRTLAALPRSGREPDITAVALNSERNLLLTASSQGVAEIWNVDTFERKAELRGRIPDVTTVVFSPDNETVLVASVDGSAQVWQVDSGEAMTQLRGHKRAVIGAAFVANGARVVTASQDGTVRAWITSDLERRADVHRHTQIVTNAKFSRNGSLLLTTSDDGTALVWEAGSGTLRASVREREHDLTNADFSPDGDAVVTIGDDQALRLWDVRSGMPLTRWEKASRGTGSLAFSPDGKWIVTRDTIETGSGTVYRARVWDVSSGQVLSELAGHTSRLSSVAFSRDSTRVVTASDDGTARVWEAGTGKPVVTLQDDANAPGNAVWSAVFSPDGARVVTTSSDRIARVWNVRDGKKQAELRGHTQWLTGAAFSPDGAKVVTASGDNTARVWDAKDGTLLFELRGHHESVSSAEFSPDGNWILSASADHIARLWNAANGKSVLQLRGHGGLTRAAFSPDGALIVTTGEDGSMQIYSCEMCRSGQDMRELTASRLNGS